MKTVVVLIVIFFASAVGVQRKILLESNCTAVHNQLWFSADNPLRYSGLLTLTEAKQKGVCERTNNQGARLYTYSNRESVSKKMRTAATNRYYRVLHLKENTTHRRKTFVFRSAGEKVYDPDIRTRNPGF